MKKLWQTGNIILLIIILMISGMNPVCSQEVKVKSGKVGFKLNNLSDSQPPTLKIVTPAIGSEVSYQTDKKEFDLIGEVDAGSKIKFVSVNSDMKEVNEYGLFSTRIELVPGKNHVRFVVMDVNDNMLERLLTLEYIPPVVTLADKISRDSKYYALLIGINTSLILE